MTPKEKANKLVLFFSELVDFTDNNFNTCYESKIKRAKICAKQCVDEILYSYDPLNEYDDSEWKHEDLTYRFILYWKDVRNEIEKL